MVPGRYVDNDTHPAAAVPVDRLVAISRVPVLRGVIRDVVALSRVLRS